MIISIILFGTQLSLSSHGIIPILFSAAEPQRVGTRNNNPNTRFFTGNQPLDAGLAGAAAGVAGQYITNQLLNPCRNRNRNNNRGQTNNRIFGGNTGNFLLGAAAGFAGASLANNIFGNPCGR